MAVLNQSGSEGEAVMAGIRCRPGTYDGQARADGVCDASGDRIGWGLRSVRIGLALICCRNEQPLVPQGRTIGTPRVRYAPTVPGAAPTVPGAAPTIPGAAPTNPGVAPTNPGASPTTPGASPTTPGAARTIPGAAPTVPGA